MISRRWTGSICRLVRKSLHGVRRCVLACERTQEKSAAFIGGGGVLPLPLVPFRQVVQLHGSARDQSEASPNNFFDLISLGAVNKVAATGDGRCEQSSFVISTRIESPICGGSHADNDPLSGFSLREKHVLCPRNRYAA